MRKEPWGGWRLCAHADLNGEGMHWMAPGERCHLDLGPHSSPKSTDLENKVPVIASSARAEAPAETGASHPPTEANGGS